MMGHRIRVGMPGKPVRRVKQQGGGAYREDCVDQSRHHLRWSAAPSNAESQADNVNVRMTTEPPFMDGLTRPAEGAGGFNGLFFFCYPTSVQT